LAARLLLGGREAFQFLDPVLHRHQLRHTRWRPLDFLNHEKTLAVRGDVEIARAPPSILKGPSGWLARLDRRSRR
jgi:hypothetical protein